MTNSKGRKREGTRVREAVKMAGHITRGGSTARALRTINNDSGWMDGWMDGGERNIRQWPGGREGVGTDPKRGWIVQNSKSDPNQTTNVWCLRCLRCLDFNPPDKRATCEWISTRITQKSKSDPNQTTNVWCLRCLRCLGLNPPDKRATCEWISTHQEPRTIPIEVVRWAKRGRERDRVLSSPDNARVTSHRHLYTR